MSSRSSRCPTCLRSRTKPVVTEGRGWGSSHALLVAYDRLLETFDLIWQYHFEFLNLGYRAYLDLYEVCRQTHPGIADQTIAKMVSGIDVLLWRPDDELRRLALLALELRVAETVRRAGSEEDLRAVLATHDSGARWLADFEATKNPWFYFSFGNGIYHHHRSWIDDTALPIAMIGSYIERLEAGENISRPRDAVIAERDRVTDEHRSLLSEEARQVFDETLELARTVFPYVESHNFYIEHWFCTIFWNKVREFGALLAGHGFLVGLGGCLPSAPRRGACGTRGAADLLEHGRRRGRAGPRLLAADRGHTEVDLRGDVSMGSPGGSRPGTRDNH